MTDYMEPQLIRTRVFPKLLILVILLLSVIIIGLYNIPNLVNANQYQQRLVDEVSKATAKKVSFDNDLSFTINPFYNNVSFTLNNVKLTDSVNDIDSNFLNSKELILNISLYDFLFGHTNITSLELHNAIINFNLLSDGSKNWLFSQKLRDNAPYLRAVIIQNSMISLGNSTYSQLNLELNINNNGSAKLSGVASRNDKQLNISADLDKYNNKQDRNLEIKLTKDKSHLNFQGIVTGDSNEQFKVNGAMKLYLMSPTILLTEIATSFPSLSSDIKDNFKDPFEITGDLAIINDDFIATNIKISSKRTNATGEFGFSLSTSANLYAHFNFDQLDATNILKFDQDNSLANIETNFNDDYTSSAIQTNDEKAYVNFLFLDSANVTLKISAKEVILPNLSLQNMLLDFEAQDGSINQGFLNFSILNDTHNTNVKLSNLVLKKIDGVSFILGDFTSSGDNIDDSLKLFDVQNYVTINDNNLNYSIASKIIFAPNEVSIFDIAGQIGDNGDFSGSIATQQKELTNFTFDLKFNNLKLTNFDLPLLKSRALTLLNKSQDDNYLSYFRWFRTLSSTYNVNLEFNNTEFKNEKLNNLTSNIILKPGSMLLSGKIDSDFAKGDYDISLAAQSIKPDLSINVKGDNLDYARFNNLFLSFLNDQANSFAKQEPIADNNDNIWSNKKFNLFKIQKYSAKLDIDLKELQIYAQKANNFKLSGHTSSDIFYVDNIYLDIYGGRFQARGNISFFDPTLYQFSFTSENLESKDLLANFLPNFDSITGSIAATGSLISKGDTPRDLIANLGVASSFAASSLNIKGIDCDTLVDLALKRKPIAQDKILALIDQTLNSGNTDIVGVSGNINATNGVLDTKNTSFKSRFTGAAFAMSMDLNNMTLSSNSQFLFSPSLDSDPINYSVLQSGDFKQGLQKTIEDTALITYIRQQYNLPNKLSAAPSAVPTTAATSTDEPPTQSDSSNYLYPQLEQNKGN